MEEKQPTSDIAIQPAVVTPEKSSPMLKGFGELLKESWNVLTRIWKRIVVLYCFIIFSIFLGISLSAILIIIVQSIFPTTEWLIVSIILFVDVIMIIVLFMWLPLMLIRSVKDRKLEFNLVQYIKGTRKDIIPYYVISALAGLIAYVGYMLLIIPGIIFSVWFMFATYEYIYQGKRGFAALQMSKVYVKGRWWNIFLLGVLPGVLLFVTSFILSMIADAELDSGVISGIAFMLRLCLTIIGTPLSLIYFILLYENVKDTYTGGDVVLTKKQRNMYVAGIVFGTVMLIALWGLIVYGITVASKNRRDPYQGSTIPDSSELYSPSSSSD